MLVVGNSKDASIFGIYPTENPDGKRIPVVSNPVGKETVKVWDCPLIQLIFWLRATSVA